MLDEETKLRINNFLDSKAKGLKDKEACDFAGISYAKIKLLIKQGSDDFDNGIESEASDFYKEYKKSTSIFILYNLSKIVEASEKDWKASAWLLEHIQPELFNLNSLEKSSLERIEIVNDINIKDERTEVKTSVPLINNDISNDEGERDEDK